MNMDKKSLFNDDYTESQELDKLGAKRSSSLTVVMLISKNVVRLEPPSNGNTHLAIHVPYKIRYVEQPESTGLVEAESPDSVPTIEGNEHVVDSILSHLKRGRGF